MKFHADESIYITKSIIPSQNNDIFLSLGVISHFPLNAEGPRSVPNPADVWQDAMDRLVLDNVIDECFPKTRGEFLVYGEACCPSELKDADKVSVKVAVGSTLKHLSVTGDREFMGAAITSKPIPFKTIPLLWNRAFGGADYSENTAGIGFAPIYDENLERECWPLPNVEYVNQPLVSKSDRPDPASLMAVSMADPRRMRLIGKVDEVWLANRWPDLPLDTHPDFFQMAPKDQWFEGFLEGGEAVEIMNMHERFPLLRARVPQIRHRIFVEQIKGGEVTITDVPSHLETLVLLPNQLSGIVLQRAVVKLTTYDGSDVLSVMVAHEDSASPALPYEYYRDRFQNPELFD